MLRERANVILKKWSGVFTSIILLELNRSCLTRDDSLHDIRLFLACIKITKTTQEVTTLLSNRRRGNEDSFYRGIIDFEVLYASLRECKVKLFENENGENKIAEETVFYTFQIN